MKEPTYWKRSRGAYRILIIISALMVIISVAALFFFTDDTGTEEDNTPSNKEYTTIPTTNDDPNTIIDGIHVRTGLVEAEGLMAVVTNCTTCHSAQLVIQNRMDRDRWIATIRWMQKTQNLWGLGDNEAVIVNYLVTNYPPINKGRRQALSQVEWYELKE
ncbi:MAG: monoheme cytochrome C [Maribacter sp.]|nr:monoheme cytochrome C [Maribacter sp.]